MRKAAHDHDRLGRAVWFDKRADTQIDIGGEPPVEVHLGLTGPLAGAAVMKVNERKGNRLLDLVDPVGGQDQP